MERFFRAYKTERMPRLGYENFDDAVADVSHYIDYYYNAIRPHLHNNGLSPITAEKNIGYERNTACRSMNLKIAYEIFRFLLTTTFGSPRSGRF